MSVHEERQLGPRLRKKSNDVILQNLSSGASPRPTRIPKTREIDKKNLKLVNGEEVSNLTKPTGMLPEAVDDSNGSFGIFGDELSVVKSNIGQFWRKVLPFDGVILLLKLAQEFIFLHYTIIYESTYRKE